jgi:hypothetical protein
MTTAKSLETEQIETAACVTNAAVFVTHAAVFVTEAAVFVTEAAGLRVQVQVAGYRLQKPADYGL